MCYSVQKQQKPKEKNRPKNKNERQDTSFSLVLKSPLNIAFVERKYAILISDRGFVVAGNCKRKSPKCYINRRLINYSKMNAGGSKQKRID